MIDNDTKWYDLASQGGHFNALPKKIVEVIQKVEEKPKEEKDENLENVKKEVNDEKVEIQVKPQNVTKSDFAVQNPTKSENLNFIQEMSVVKTDNFAKGSPSPLLQPSLLHEILFLSFVPVIIGFILFRIYRYKYYGK